MEYAVVIGADIRSGSTVGNVLIAAPSQKAEMEAALGAVLLEATPLGLMIGDMYDGAVWTREVDGERATLPIVPEQQEG